MTQTFPRITSAPSAETGIPRAHLYRISRRFIRGIQPLVLSLDGHRLLHALAHATCRYHTDWNLALPQPDQGFRCSSIALRHVLGLAAANCNRNLWAGMKEIGGAFDFLGFTHGNTCLCWRFTDEAFDALLDPEAYGLFDARLLPVLSSPLDYAIATEVALVRRMRRPSATLAVDELALMFATPTLTWSGMSTRCLTALRRVAAHYGLLMVLQLDCQGYLRSVDRVHVRMQTWDSTWTVRDLAKTEPTTRRVLILDGTRHAEVAPQMLDPYLRKVAKAGWTLSGVMV